MTNVATTTTPHHNGGAVGCFDDDGHQHDNNGDDGRMIGLLRGMPKRRAQCLLGMWYAFFPFFVCFLNTNFL